MITASGSWSAPRAGRRPFTVLPVAAALLLLCSCTTGSGITSEPGTTDSASGGTGTSVTAEGGDGSMPPGAATPAAGQPGEGTPPATTPAESPPTQDSSSIRTSVDAALRSLALGQDSVTRDQVRSAIEQGFTDAGVVPEAVEVSIDSTPTGLDVDAIQGAGRSAGECIIGEIREGAVSVTVLPVLGSGMCFVGDQR